MARRALDSAPRMSHYVQGMKINDTDAFNNLSEVTVSLWKEGMSTSFWPHNAIQTSDYTTIILPPYHFEKEKHWVELRSPVELIEQIKEASRSENSTLTTDPIQDKNQRWVFTGCVNSNINGERQPCFNINTTSKEYQTPVSRHLVANKAINQVIYSVGSYLNLWRMSARFRWPKAPHCERSSFSVEAIQKAGPWMNETT